MATSEVILVGGNGHGFSRIERVFVTPEMAREWLDRPAELARREQAKTIETYASEMRGGWGRDLDLIRLARNGGWVMNGRHRLNAVVETDIGQWFLVAYDCDPDDFDYIDRGRSRTVTNVLESHHYKNANALEAAARLIHAWRRGSPSFNPRQTPGQIQELAEAHSEALQPLFPLAKRASLQTRVKLPGGKTKTAMPPAMAAVCALLEGALDQKSVIGRLADWPDEEIYNHPADAVALFRDALTKRGGRGADLSKRVVMSLFILAKNLDYTGAPLPEKGLMYRPAAAFPTPEWPATIPWGADRRDEDDEDE
jgi:hypothetical protein